MNSLTQDIKDITKTIDDYFLGMYEADTEKLKAAFAEEALIIGYFQGMKAFLSVEQFCDFAKDSPMPKDQGEEYDMRISSIDITDSIALVKAENLYQGLRFTDYLSLMKIDDKWSIVNKTYRHL